MSARKIYDKLAGNRSQFLNTAIECSELTLPYLVTEDTNSKPHKTLRQPWQNVGSSCVNVLASKLMLALLPPQTTFFKLQVRDDKLGELDQPQIRSELDLSFSKIERTIMDFIAASNDRVVVHQAIKHLIVSGNSLIYMGKEGLKNYPLNRFVVSRDGNGSVIEIVTKEIVAKELLSDVLKEYDSMNVSDDSSQGTSECDVYTHVRMENGRWVWHQEVHDMIIPGSRSTAPKNASPWLPLRFVSVDSPSGEDYGRGRVEEFLGDLRSLNALSQALIEGSSAAAKVVFMVSPSSTTKPASLAKAGNGAIIQGRPDDVSVVQVGKTADFATAANMAQQIERRIGEGFLKLNIRQSERTTAEEVRLTQLELEQQLGGLFSLLTVEFLVPYLNRIMLVLQRNGQLPKIPKEFVRPQIVAGVNALGRGQDRESLSGFMQTVAQTLGPEALLRYINPTEVIKRLAAAQGIDVLNLIKTEEQLAQEQQQEKEDQIGQSVVNQAGQLARSPIAEQAMQMGQEEQTPPPTE
jgi:hypothetical protein